VIDSIYIPVIEIDPDNYEALRRGEMVEELILAKYEFAEGDVFQWGCGVYTGSATIISTRKAGGPHNWCMIRKRS